MPDDSAFSAPGARMILEALPFPALLVAPNDDLLAHNSAARALFGSLSGADLPATFKEIKASYLVPGLRASLEQVKRQAPATTLADVAWDAGERTTQLRVLLRRVDDAPGHLTGVLLIVLDRADVAGDALLAEHAQLLAERRIESEELEVMNEELRSANDNLREQLARVEEAKAADTRKNEFLAMLAHELRNPLGAVVNALHVIRRVGSADRRILHAVRIADRQLRHEARLLDDLLDVSRIIVGKVTVRSEAVDLRGCVRSVVETAAFAIRSQSLEVIVDLPDAPLIVSGDATRLEQCIGNLLSNAIKFTPAGGHVTIHGRADERQAVVTVHDTGVGIAPEMLARVFDLFAQADASLARARGGLGIGLTLARRLVELHGGTLNVRSGGPGRGSEFEIRLPLSPAAPVAAVPPTAPKPRSRHVLVVEDNRDAREILRVVLEMEGHTVTETGDGPSAVRLAVERAPDIVLLDIGLPDLDGFEVARRIRARLGNTVRLVALSGYGDAAARARGVEAGFDAHLVKPVAPDDLTRLFAAL